MISLIEELRTILEVHPEIQDAEVWATMGSGKQLHVQFVGIDKKHKPTRLKLSG